MRKINIGLYGIWLLAWAFFSACNTSSNKEQHSAVLDTVSLSSKSFALAYQDGEKIVATSIDTMNQISFGGATEPAISPDGNKLAYTVIDSLDGRSIWIADLENKSQLQLQTASSNFYGANWAPDGNLLSFSVFNADSVWKIGIIKPDNTGFLMLDNQSNISYHAPTWKGKNQILAHDLEKLYTFDTSGKLLSTQKISDLITKDYFLSGGSHFFYTKDEKGLVFNAGYGPGVEELHGKIESVFLLNLENKKISRISPEGINVPYLFVTADNRVFYSGAPKPFTNQKVYIADLDGNVKILVDKGAKPTAALK